MVTTIIPPENTININNFVNDNNNKEILKLDIFEWCHSENYWCEVDKWYPLYGEEHFTHTRNSINLNVSDFYGECNKPSQILDTFMLTPKRCYNSDEIRKHICRYLNYFERFYDKEHELIFMMQRIKIAIDIGVWDINLNGYRDYTCEEFLHDIKTYILSPSIYNKVWRMVECNYKIDLTYKNKANEGLQYTNRHGKYLMEISIMMNILIPLIMHWVYTRDVTSKDAIDDFIYTIYNTLIDMYMDPIRMSARGLQLTDIYAKLYETAITTMNSNHTHNEVLWNMSEIRGYSPTINANDAVNTVIMQVIPKYTFSGNIIIYNLAGVRNNIKFNISDISYEFDYMSLSSSKRDGEDNTSQFDKFEAHLIKTDEGLAIQNDFRAKRIVESIIAVGGEVSDEEVNFYRKALTKHGQPLINTFQHNMINNFFFKDFGDTVSVNSINGDQYIKLMIIAKRLLISQGMLMLPYIIASVVNRISTRTSLCKKELTKIEQSEYYNDLKKKYNGNEKIMKAINSTIATVLSSSFKVIDYENPNINGVDIPIDSDVVIDEMLRFILAI